jgi:hypothetical protein
MQKMITHTNEWERKHDNFDSEDLKFYCKLFGDKFPSLEMSVSVAYMYDIS